MSGGDYRYGMNGQEKEPEITGSASHYSAEYWMYDARLGRRWNVDPVIKTHESPYATFANNPIWFTDPSGADSAKLADRQQALATVNAFQKTYSSFTPYYKNISSNDFFNDLKDLITNPGSVDQGALNLCGPAYFFATALAHDPEGIAKTLITMYYWGAGNYNGLGMQANPTMMNQSAQDDKGQAMNSATWIGIASLRYSESVLTTYDPATDEGIAAFSTFSEVSSWLGYIPNATSAIHSQRSAEFMNRYVEGGYSVGLLVDWNRITPGMSYKQSKQVQKGENKGVGAYWGNHYIGLTKPILFNGNNVTIEVWTWGGTQSFTLPKTEFEEAVKNIFITK